MEQQDETQEPMDNEITQNDGPGGETTPASDSPPPLGALVEPTEQPPVISAEREALPWSVGEIRFTSERAAQDYLLFLESCHGKHWRIVPAVPSAELYQLKPIGVQPEE